MFRPTNRQSDLWGAPSSLPESSRERLVASWADGFSRKVYPVLLGAEERFSELYCSDNGRPNWSTARMLGICLLQEMLKLSDQEALDQLLFDVRWQHALALRPDQAYLSRRSLVDFRSRLVSVDPQMKRVREVFDAVSDGAIEDLGLCVRDQRLDSTLVTSNIRTKGRYDLFTKTLRHCLDSIGRTSPARLGVLSAALREWMEHEADGWFGKKSDEEYRQQLQTVGSWLVEVLDAFRGDESIAQGEPYRLVSRVVEDHLKVERGGAASPHTDGTGGPTGEASEPVAGGEVAGSAEGEKPQVSVGKPSQRHDSLQSPYDPDAGYGHKGSGYHVHVAETCNNAATEIITDYSVELPLPDQDQAVPAVNRLAEAGRQPEYLYADAGYGNGTAFAACEGLGTALVAPFPTGNMPEGWIGRDQFECDTQTGQILRCPAGHESVRRGERRSPNERGSKAPHVYFNRQTCEQCALRGRCCARPPGKGRSGCYSVELSAALLARDKRHTELRTDAFWEKYGVRAGIEATMSELKRAHGLGDLRVRRRPRVTLAVAMKLTACNVKRWLRAAANAVVDLIPDSPVAGPSRMLARLCRAALMSSLAPAIP
jgi:hypothetical protein